MVRQQGGVSKPNVYVPLVCVRVLDGIFELVVGGVDVAHRFHDLWVVEFAQDLTRSCSWYILPIVTLSDMI